MVKLFTTASFVLFSSLVVAADASTIAASTSSSTCDPCIDRNSVKIGVVHHGLPIEDVYWEHMNEAITQGAKDTNIDLHYKPLLDGHTLLDNQQKIFDEMSAQIEEYCSIYGDNESAMDALLVTLPNDSILPAVLTCKEKNIKIVVFNVGLELAESNGLLFVGQDEFEAGYKAGEGLNNNTTTKVMCCANHSPGNAVLNKRCGGMAASVAVSEGDAAITSTYDVPVNPNDCSSFTAAIVNQCSPPEGDWSTVGLYLAGKPTHKCGMEFLKEYPEVSVTASDVSVDLYEGMVNNSGLSVLFGIDQQSYLQGYLPFSFLTLAVTNNQAVINSKIETGPSLVYNPPSEDELDCKANYYAVCNEDDTVSGGNTSSNNNVNNDGISIQSTTSVSNNAWAIVLGMGILAGLGALILVKMIKKNKKVSDSITTLAEVPIPAKMDDIEIAHTSLGSKEMY